MALRSASSAKGLRSLSFPSIHRAATDTSLSWSRVAPGPKSDRRPNAMTRTRESCRVRTTVTRLRSWAL